MSTERVLQMNSSRECFEEISSGRRRTEYRPVKPFWSSRLDGKSYGEIHFRNGYGKNAPFARVEFKGCTLVDRDGEPFYAVSLGKVLEVQR
ncbi:hypothetical protein IT575_14380 [bacterium]|nr:hypothetical protein [bacterium]